MLRARRNFLKTLTSVSAFGAVGSAVAAEDTPNILLADLRGKHSAKVHGLLPSATTDQSRVFQDALDTATKQGKPLFLEAGEYRLSNIMLPDGAKLMGVSGATRIIFGGSGHLFFADAAQSISLTGLVFDGQNRKLPDYAPGLFSATNVTSLSIENCQFLGSGYHGLDLVECGGHVRNSIISGAADISLFAKQSRGLTIKDNEIRNAGNGGILVHRFLEGEDGTIVSGNRIENIGSSFGGTGQWGNGINIYRAHNVMVSGNHISDCAFSAVRGNTSKNLQVIGNHCLRSGETALYSEFGHEGSVFANNIVDGGTIGISLANFNEGGRMATVSGNVIRNITDVLPYEADQDLKPGIGISVEADSVVTGNVIENTPHYGILAGWGPFLRNVVVTSNVVRNVPYGIGASVAPKAGTVLIRDNMLHDIGKTAISGWEWVIQATDELVDASESGHENMRVSGNVRMS